MVLFISRFNGDGLVFLHRAYFKKFFDANTPIIIMVGATGFPDGYEMLTQQTFWKA